MKSFDQYLNEVIDGREIERIVRDAVEKVVNENSSKRLSAQIKDVIKYIADEFDFGLPFKNSVRMVSGSDIHGSFEVVMDRATLKPQHVQVVLVIGKAQQGDFKKDLIEMLTHEFVHAEQAIRAGYKSHQSAVRKGDVGDKDYKSYLADDVEVEAYAMNAAQEIKAARLDDKKINVEKAVQLMGNTKVVRVMSANSESFEKYYRLFGRSNNRNDQNVWKRFVKKFIQHTK